MTDQCYERATQLMEADLHDEMVALDPVGGRCFGFNEVATAVWRLLERPRTNAQLQEALMDEFEVEPEQCAIELNELLRDLAERGLIRPASA